MDVNRDGSISSTELQEALQRGHTSHFSKKTIDIFISKYDKNEFRDSMLKKGYQFNNKFFEFIVDEIRKKTGNYGIKFDDYIR